MPIHCHHLSFSLKTIREKMQVNERPPIAIVGYIMLGESVDVARIITIRLCRVLRIPSATGNAPSPFLSISLES